MAIIDILNAEVAQQVVDSLGGKRLINSLITNVERLAQTTDTLSSDISATLASTVLLVGNLTETTNALALDLHYLLQGCIALVALLCLLTVLCIRSFGVNAVGNEQVQNGHCQSKRPIRHHIATGYSDSRFGAKFGNALEEMGWST
ncbi:hypothetical protein DEU56DRAFT_901866 [Suillus clintonianus]|uniref:uncharacterized protein n=1 Tax=Suillus clintonianus TaxID=1904413 RepID=UPI001B88034D|nr:uncharacterized protein DEU56DRAFT_901866 [Suillus clintonianus]KAG2135115.1 hypothetical protein DEU56DRAFT_901866 [Suillus clintonianus]